MIRRRDRPAGEAHRLIFYGFVLLFLGTATITLDYDILVPFSACISGMASSICGSRWCWTWPVSCWRRTALYDVSARLAQAAEARLRPARSRPH